MIPKFRAWDSVKKKFVEHFFITDNGLICNMEKPTSDYNSPIPIEKSELILMQSTGLVDKNGKEIFEKDIVDFKGRKAIVKWHGSYASFIYEFVDELQNRTTEWQPLYLSYYHFEIIGNIYESTEMLEVTE